MPEAKKPEWLVERGIGEDRALLIHGDRVLASKLRWHGEMFAGQVLEARLASRSAGSARGTALASDGLEILVDHLPRDAQEGARYDVRITRPPIAERGRLKRAQGRIASHDDAPIDDVFATGREVRSFPQGMWEDIWQSASSGEIGFDGGSLLFSVTPAMTLIDIDGKLSPRELALAAVPAIARWLPRFDLGGSIGIDFPTLAAKADRKAVDAALESALQSYSHERTAMNGFGFVHIVARLEGPSLLHRFAASRVGMAARMLLRRGELAQGTGRTVLLTCHPAIKAKLKPGWLAELERRSGKTLRIESDPGIAIAAGHAQIVGDD